MNFLRLNIDDNESIAEMSAMATGIVREHFDPLIGSAQNDYMISKFQTKEAIKKQLLQGYRYYFVRKSDRNIGFLAFYPKHDVMYLSKFYLYKEERGNGYAEEMLRFVINETLRASLPGIELNVNRHNSACRVYDSLGFKVIRTEKNDIGSGYFMDDYVYYLELADRLA